MPEKPYKSLQITTIDLTAYCFLRSWFKYLCEHGFQVTYASTMGDFRCEIEKTGARTIDIPIARSLNPLRDFVSLIKLYHFMKREKFDSVQTYTSKAGFIGRLAAKLAGVPVIIHNMLEPPHNSVSNPVLKGIYIFLEKIAAGWADHIITTTQPNVKEILKSKIVPESKLTAIPEGLDIEKYDAVRVDEAVKRAEIGVAGGKIMLVTAGRLEDAKGHRYLIQAAPRIIEKYPEVRFVFVGKGRLLRDLQSMIEGLGLKDYFIFVGFRDDLLEIVKCCDLFVLPSLWEGQGVVLMEAMALKKPLVACGVGGVVDVVEDGETGVLVPPRNPGALADAVIKVLSNPENMKEMGAAGYRRIVEKFDDKEANERRYQVYKMLFDKKLRVKL